VEGTNYLMTHEDVILVDADDHEIGTEEKLMAHQRGHSHSRS